MKKLIIVLSIVLILTACDTANMENENNGNGGKGSEAEYYPFEVTNLKYEIEKGPPKEPVLVKLSWENPKDENFSHVSINRGEALDPDTVYYQYYDKEPVRPKDIYCVDKQGKFSRGVRCLFGGADYD